jgi:riboflavin transporter FmnP
MGDFPAFPNWSFVEVPSLLYHVLSGVVVEEHHTIAKKIGTFLRDVPSQDFQHGEIAAFVNSVSVLQETYQP